MATFDLQRYFESGGRSVSNDIESIKEAIAALENAPAGLTNNQSYTDWARMAAEFIRDVEAGSLYDERGGKQVSKLDLAHQWITGAMQPNAAKRVFGTYQENLDEMMSGYQNAMENLANVTDFRNVSPEQQAKILESDTYKQALAKVQQFEQQMGSLQESGFKLDIPVLTRDANGNFSSMAVSERNRTLGRSGEQIGRRFTEDGTVEIYGTRSGSVLKTLPSGTSDVEIQRVMNEMQAGSRGDLTGAFGAGDSTGGIGDGTTGGGATGDGTTGGGTTGGGTGDGTTGGGTTTDPAATDFAAILQGMGIDTANLTPEQIQSLGAMASIVQGNAERDKQIAPPTQSAQAWDSFMAQAASEMDPYYQELFDTARQDLTQAMGVLTGEWTQQEADWRRNFENQRLQQAEQAAEANIARSGIRNRAEEQLTDQQRGIVQSGRRQAQNTLYGLGSVFERQFGLPGLAAAGNPMLAAQGMSEIGVNPTQMGYMPLGIELGNVGRQRKTDLTQRAQELSGDDMTKQYGLTYNEWPL